VSYKQLTYSYSYVISVVAFVSFEIFSIERLLID